jgi:dipeptidyl aminopeptidase/acylaminoacyl peptidase
MHTSLRSLSPRNVFVAVLALLALAIPATASAATHREGAVVFSQTQISAGVEEGGLFAVKDGHQNQLTEDPADSEPSFSLDGRTIAFARDGHIYTVRPDGSGERRLTNGTNIDSRPQISPNGRIVLFERAPAGSEATKLYTVPVGGGAAKLLTGGTEEEAEARFAPDGKTIVFVRTSVSGGRPNDDLYSVRPNGSGLTRLTTTARVDEFDPRYFAGGIVFSRGNQSEGAAGYADIYTMKKNGTKVKPLVEGVGSAYVEDVSPQGHTLIFRRDRGLWQKQIGPATAKKVAELPDGSETNSVFSSDGRSVATLIGAGKSQELMSINLATGRKSDLAEAYDGEGEATFGPVIDWQPTR